MSAAYAPLIPELEEALGHIPAERQAGLARRFADFFVAGAPHFNELHVRLFDRMLCRLAEGLESAVLAELARRLAPVPNAPPDLMRRLAYDDSMAVAGPVLARSRCLADEDLIEIARTRSQAHMFAISGRPAVSEAVSDVLVAWGDRDVTRNVAMNQRARFSEAGIAMLAWRAARDQVLGRKLTQRADLPPDIVASLVLEAGADRVLTRIDEVRAELHRLSPPNATRRVIGLHATRADQWREAS
jgi:uncharacterized protein (DUF2336 family)